MSDASAASTFDKSIAVLTLILAALGLAFGLKANITASAIAKSQDVTQTRVVKLSNDAEAAINDSTLTEQRYQFNFTSRINFYADFVTAIQEVVRTLTFVRERIEKNELNGDVLYIVGQPLGKAGAASAPVGLIASPTIYKMSQRLVDNSRCASNLLAEFRTDLDAARAVGVSSSILLRAQVLRQTSLVNKELRRFIKYVQKYQDNLEEMNDPRGRVWALGEGCDFDAVG